jgi:hypothetical protein
MLYFKCKICWHGYCELQSRPEFVKPKKTCTNEDSSSFAYKEYAMECKKQLLPRCSSALLFIILTTLISVLQINKDAHAAQVNLEWQSSQPYAVEGYIVHWGISSRTYSESYDVGLATNHTVSGLDEDTVYYFAITAYYGDLESAYSNEVSALSGIPLTDGPRNGNEHGSSGCTMNPRSNVGLEWALLFFLPLFFRKRTAPNPCP